MEIYALSACLIIALVAFFLSETSHRKESREVTRALIRQINRLENRIVAKDLSGYMALEDGDRERHAPRKEVVEAREPFAEAEAWPMNGA